MNLRDLERRRNQLKETIKGVSTGPYSGGWNGYRQMEFLDKLIECFSTKQHKSPSKIEAKNAFNKIYGFEKQKTELTQFIQAQNYLNSQTAKNELSNKIICLVGPPGIGKTAFAKSIAEILGKKFYLISLAGKFQTGFLDGDLPSYVSASCGQIVEAIIKTKSTDPVILLDEVDKASDVASFHIQGTEGIPGVRSTLLQILDPLQNKEFKDNYLDAKIDLSQITFVLTANSVDNLDPALKSRLEIIQLEGYSPQDKKHIAKLILYELLLQTNYLNSELLEITDSAWEELIKLTHEEGVRQLKQGINKILIYCYSQWAEDYNNNLPPRKMLINPAKIKEIIPEEFFVIKDSKQEEEKHKRLKEEKEREELIQLDKQWRSNQQKFQNKLLMIMTFILISIIILGVGVLFKKKNQRKTFPASSLFPKKPRKGS